MKERCVMSTQTLNPQQRRIVIEAVREQLRTAAPHLFSPDGGDMRGAMDVIVLHLDELIDIVRRSTAQRIEAYDAQLLDEVCPHCPRQQPNQRCALREAGECALFRYIDAVVVSIGAALKEIGDVEYWFNHPVGSVDLEPPRHERVVPVVYDPSVPVADDRSTFVSDVVTKAERTEPLAGYSPTQLRLALDYAAQVSPAADAHVRAWAGRCGKPC